MQNSGTLEITTVIGCKIQCKYCPQALLTRTYLEKSRTTRMDFDTFKVCIDKIPTSVEIHFSGMAEPWLSPDCTDMVLYAAERGHPIAVYTTLVGMTKRDFDRIKKIPFTAFIIHIPAVENYSHIPITPEHLALVAYVTNYLNCSPIRKAFGASCHGPVDPRVIEAVGEKAFHKELNLGITTRMVDRAGNLDFSELPHPFQEGPIVCNLCTRQLNHNVLLPNGDVVLCCMDYGLEYRLGNLLQDDYPSLFTSKAMLDLKQAMEDDSQDILCRHCHNVAPANPETHIQVLEPAADTGIQVDNVLQFAGRIASLSGSKLAVIDTIAAVELGLQLPQGSTVVINHALPALVQFPHLIEPVKDLTNKVEKVLLRGTIPAEMDINAIESSLIGKDLPVEFSGLVRGPEGIMESLVVLSRVAPRMTTTTPSTFRVVAILSTYNEEDIICQTIERMIEEGVQVYLIDNWSTDRTYEMASRYLNAGVVGLERFPESGPAPTYSWEDILRRKAQLSIELEADWFIHHDADEIRESPWRGIRLWDAIFFVDQQGYNAIDFTTINFVPVDNSYVAGSSLDTFRYFEFGNRPGHFLQIKAWKNQGYPVDLTSSGGHEAKFTDRRVFPYKFLLRHYPVRSQSHGEKKVLQDRLPRYNEKLRKIGWHHQYDSCVLGHNYLKKPEELTLFEPDFHYYFLIERLSGIG